MDKHDIEIPSGAYNGVDNDEADRYVEQFYTGKHHCGIRTIG